MESEQKVLPQNENQFNFRNIGKAIAKFKWWIIGATVVGTVAGYLAFRLGVNPGRETLVSSFGYNINAKAKVDENTTLKEEELANQTLYLSDSSIFSYTDIVSEERLAAVKDADPEKFSNIDPVKMAKNGAFKISRASYTDQTTGKVIYEYPAKYTIKVGKSNFASEQQGKDFIEALINYELVVAKTANDNYEITDYIGSVSGASYSQYVDKLEKQYDAINECYKGLVKEFNNSSVATSDGKSLNVVYTAFSNKYSYGAGNLLQKYEGDLYYNHLVDYANVSVKSLTDQGYAYKENVRNCLISLGTYEAALNELVKANITNNNANSEIEKEIVKVNNEIMNLKDVTNSYLKELANLGFKNTTNVTIDTVDNIKYDGSGDGVIQRLTAGESTWKAMCDEFKASLDDAAKKLNEDRDSASQVYGYVHNLYNNKVNMYTAGTAELTGHVSSFIGAAVGLVAMFVLSTFVFTLIYISKKDKYENK